RVTRGAILDVIVDLRPESPTYLQHVGVELTAENHRALYVPKCFAHGYQVLENDTETSYHVGEFYAPASEGGLLYSDPRLGLRWPLPVTEISEKDQGWKPLGETEPELQRRMRACPPPSPCAGDRNDHRRSGPGLARRAGTSAQSRHDRRGIHGPGAHESDRQQRARYADGDHLQPHTRQGHRGLPLRGLS